MSSLATEPEIASRSPEAETGVEKNVAAGVPAEDEDADADALDDDDEDPWPLFSSSASLPRGVCSALSAVPRKKPE